MTPQDIIKRQDEYIRHLEMKIELLSGERLFTWNSVRVEAEQRLVQIGLDIYAYSKVWANVSGLTSKALHVKNVSCLNGDDALFGRSCVNELLDVFEKYYNQSR